MDYSVLVSIRAREISNMLERTKMQSPASKHIAPSDRITGWATRAMENPASESAATTFWMSIIITI
jgi:hypothetical protein